MNGIVTIPSTYDYRLITLSLAIAVLAAYAALDLAGRVSANHGSARLAWLMGGAVSLGSGIWAMHYTGMLAFRLPIRVYYHIPTVILSLLAAIFSSWVALYVVSRKPAKWLHMIVGSLLMGGGIATMHYTGMASMRLAAMHHYDPGLLLLSIFLAVAISLIGLLLIARSSDDRRGWKTKSATALLVGLAIPVMHYTGMAAVSFMPSAVKPDLSYSVDISTVASSSIIAMTFLVLGFVLVTALVDRRLSAQQSVLNNERKMLRALIDNIPDFMYVKDTQGRFVFANAHLAEVLGANSPAELVGKTDFDFFPAVIASVFHAIEQQVIISAQPLFNHEELGHDRQGSTTYVLTTRVPLRNNDGVVTGIAGVGRDISKRKKGEEALRLAHREAEVFINAVPSILIGINRASCVTRWNFAAASTFGIPATEVAGKELADCGIKWVRPGMPDEVRSWCSEHTPRRADKVPFERNGRTRLLGLTIIPVHMADAGLTELLVIGSDITERSALEEQLRQAQKLESVGQLAAGIAHEINTPTQYIGDNVRFLKDAFQDLKSLLATYEGLFLAAKENTLSAGTIHEVAAAAERVDPGFLLEEIPKAIEQTLEGVTRVATLVSAMKEFSHPGSKEKTPLDLNHAIASTITVSRNEWKYVADLETEFDPALPLISCLAGEFNQVILNLIVNAAHAIGDVAEKGGSAKGKIRVQTQDCPDWAEIRIEDTGGGIPEKVQSRIFDPFFTTKAIGKGTGQGLAIARSVVVDKHSGTIHFETEAGKGTTFVIRLPHDGAALAAKAGKA